MSRRRNVYYNNLDVLNVEDVTIFPKNVQTIQPIIFEDMYRLIGNVDVSPKNEKRGLSSHGAHLVVLAHGF